MYCIMFELVLYLPLYTHTHTHIDYSRKDHTLSQPVCEKQHVSCALFRVICLCNVVVRKTLISDAVESALLHHWTILVELHHGIFLSLTFMIKNLSMQLTSVETHHISLLSVHVRSALNTTTIYTCCVCDPMCLSSSLCCSNLAGCWATLMYVCTCVVD